MPVSNREPSGSPVMQQKFLTVTEVAAITRLSRMTIYRLVNSGELEARRFGRTFRIPEDVVTAFLNGTGGASAR